MKKIYTLALVGLFTCTLFGQQIQKRHSFGNDVNNSVRHIKSSHATGSAVAKSSSTLQSGYIDYSWYAMNDLTYVWRFNSNFTSADTSLNYACVALNQFGVFGDYVDNALEWDNMGLGFWPTTMTIDSVFVLVTQENNSGNYVKYGIDLIKLNTLYAPTTTSAVVYTVRDSTNVSLSSDSDWLGATALLAWAPNYTSNCLTEKIGINFIYKSADIDTASILASCIDDGLGGTMTQAAYSTSYMRYPPYINSISANRNIGYGTPVGSGGWFEAQDFEIWAKVSFDDAFTGFNEVNKNDFKVYQNSPNPFTGKTTIRYYVGKTTDVVQFHMYDLTGRLIMDKTDKNVSAGDYSIVIDGDQFAKGVYIYTFDVNNVKITKKMIIE